MPELPEVETIRRDLAPHIVGRTVENIRILRPSVLIGGPQRFRTAVRGRTIADCRRHGKVLIVQFAGGHSLLVHPRMTGQVIWCPEGCGTDYPRILFHLDDGHTLAYSDCRALGRLEVCETAAECASCSLGNFGPDALAPGALDALTAAASKRRTPIKVLLLDQSVIAGIGNIYASEILHLARVRPDIAAADLSRVQLDRLGRAVNRILEQAIQARGTTLSDYRTGLGTRGAYSRRLRVYGREGERCRQRRCRGTVVRCVQQQRSTFYCPECQR